ncbi:MAG: hypothetical protein MUE65_03560 [Methanomassiliicoccales archaeon]|nr:hypothetical protein [Methanomassiliicoccales archaeon]
MEAGQLLALLLLAVPALASVLCLLLRGPKWVMLAVAACSSGLIFLSIALFAFLTWEGSGSVEIETEELYLLPTALLVLDFLLLATFLAIGAWRRSWEVVLLSLAQIVPLAWFEYLTFGEEADPVIVIDMLSVELVLITSIVGSLICIYALRYMEHDARRASFMAVMLAFLAAMNGAVICNSLVWLLVFWEATTLCSYLLIRHERTAEAEAAALSALKYTLAGGLAFVMAIILAYEELGTVLLSGMAGTALAGLALLPFALLAIAAFTKSAQMPFHRWLLGAMVAPTPVSALLHSSTMVNLGVYLLLRLSPSLSSVQELSWPVALAGAATFMATSVLAMGSTSSKKVLAYSTIGNLGLIVVCAAIGSTDALLAGMLLLLFHAISKALLFLTVGVVKHETGSDDIEGMAGLRERMPFVSFALLVGVVTILLPPFGAFASKWMISEIMVSMPLLAIPLAIGFAASIVYYVKWLGRAFSLGPRSRAPSPAKDPLAPAFKWTLGALVVGAVALPFLIDPLAQYLLGPFLGLLPSDMSWLSTSLGSLPLLALVTIVVVAAAAIASFAKVGEEEVSTPYTSGEPCGFELANPYPITGKGERALESASVLVTMALLVIILAFPLLQEVSPW